MDIVSRGVNEANEFIISELLLKKPAHMLCPNPRAKTIIMARSPHNLRVTIIALLALSGRPAPNSFDTLVLSQCMILFVSICETEDKSVEFERKES